MTSMELYSLPTIVEQIRQLCSQLRTGTVFLVSDQNRMVQVHLERGEIALLQHRNRRGQEALQVIADMRQARLRFDEAYVTRTERDGLSNHAVFEYLGSAARAAPAQAATLSAATRSAIEALTVRYIGPMAEIVCAEHFARTDDLPSLVRALAAEIPSSERAERFCAELVGLLGPQADAAQAGGTPTP